MAILVQKCKEKLLDKQITDLRENKLGMLFAIQKNFTKRFHKLKVDNFKKSYWTRVYMEAIDHEIAELRELLPWKNWKQYGKDFKFDEEEIRFEIADLMCFLMDIALLWGMDGDKFYQYVYSKQLLNVKRQEDPKFGYVKKNGKKKAKKNIL
jgi:hypothetical protein